MSKKKYTYYYYDEFNDDFANNGIESKPTPKDYDYLPKSLVFRFFKPIVYYITYFLFRLGFKLFCRVSVKNKKVIRKRKDKKKGFFIYGNHTGWFMDAISGPIGAFPRQNYTIVNSDAININGLKTLIRFWGALPVPEQKITYVNFIKAINTIYNRGQSIVIYPEAHIWPKYDKIRDFSTVSFNFPARLNAPCFTKTTVFRKKKNGKTKPVIFYDGPFYPDESLPMKERELDLKERIRNALIERSQKEGSALDCDYQYIKVDSPDKVKSVIIKK